MEEYPFGNSLNAISEEDRIRWSGRAVQPVLRLIPGHENQTHSAFLKAAASHEYGDQAKGEKFRKGLAYCKLTSLMC